MNLKPSQISLSSSFMSMGGDSISAMMVQNQCKKQGLGITVQDILAAKSISHLTSSVRTVDQMSQPSERPEEDFDLSPIQSLYSHRPDHADGHFNQSFYLRLTKRFEGDAIQQAIKGVVNRHSMLRARFRLSEFDDEWKQRITLDTEGSYRFTVHKCKSKDDATQEIAKTQLSLDPVDGPMFAANLFETDDGSQLLFLVGHHLVIDLVSWRNIIQDLEDTLTNPKSTIEAERVFSFQNWCKLQVEHCSKLPLKSVLPAVDIPAWDPAYWGMANQPNVYGDLEHRGFEIDPTSTNLITSSIHDVLRTDTVDILVAAMLSSFAAVSHFWSAVVSCRFSSPWTRWA